MSAIFEAHGIHDSLDALGEQLDLLEGPKGREDDPRTERLISIGELARTVVDGVDPRFVSPTMLDLLQQDVDTATAQLRAFHETADAASIAQAEAALDSVLTKLGWGVSVGQLATEGIQEAATAYRRSVGQLARAVRADSDALSELVGRANEATDRLEQRISAEVERVGAEVEARYTPQVTRVEELEKTVDQQKGRLDTAIATFQEQFSTAEAKRSQRFEALVTERAAAADAALSDAKERMEQTQAGLEASAQEILDNLKRYEQNAAKLAATVAGLDVASGYGLEAASQKKSADWWRRIAVGAVVGAILWVVAIVAYEFLVLKQAGLELSFVARLAVSIGFFVLAAYAAQQSGRHRHNERGARQRSLELTALEPYIGLLPPDDQNKIKAEMAGRFFGQPIDPQRDDDQVGAAQLLDLLKKMIDKS